jgi:hypothetical protein
MTGRPVARRWVGLGLAAVLASAPACELAVNHPAVMAGAVGGSLALGTCKLASDSNATCLLAGGAVGALLGLVAAAALWLGGDGHSVLVEEQARPLPDDGRPLRRMPTPAPDPATAAPPPDAPLPPGATTPASPAPASPAPASPAPANPAAPSPAPGSPAPGSPAPASATPP